MLLALLAGNLSLFLVFAIFSCVIAMWVIAYTLIYIAKLMEANNKKLTEIGNQK